jgi:hypothetical protein
MKKSIFKYEKFFKMGTTDLDPPLVDARLYWCRRRMGLGDFELITEP